MKILLVEDDFALAMGTEFALQAEGYEVIRAKDVSEAKLAVTSSKPDFIKFTNGVVDVAATNKGSDEPLEIDISNLSRDIGLIGTTCKLTSSLAPDISGKMGSA